MGSMFKDNVMRIALFLSLTGHLLFLGMPFGLRRDSQIEKDDNELEITYIKIEKPALLPQIDVIGEEKKLKREDREQKTEDRKEQEPLAEEIAIEEPKKEVRLPEERVEVIDSSQEAMLRYQDMVKQRIEEVRRYPSWAKRQGVKGAIQLNFVVLANGLSKDIKIVSSSGFRILDQEALSTIQRANPFPPIPPQINQDSVAMEVIIVFALD